MKNILIIGATSAIAEAVARLYASEGNELFLVGRNGTKLENIQLDLCVRGASDVHCFVADLCNLMLHSEIIEAAQSKLKHIDITLIAHGTLGDQKDCEKSPEQTLKEINTNAISTISLLTQLGNLVETQTSGTIAVVSSVAGDRGRKSNYVYGASKALVNTFASGLRNRLAAKNGHVLTIKPGFVDTPMTENFPKGPLWVKPEKIAIGIVHAIEKNRNSVYLPGFWQPIMWIIKLIPESLFKRLNL